MKIIQKKIKNKSKRVGRGPASNKGKTSGRGMNGQRSRSGASTKHIFGGQTKLYIRLPKIPKLKPIKGNKIILTYDYVLDNFKDDEVVSCKAIVKKLGEKNNTKKIKIISGKKKVEKRKIDNTVLLSKTLKNIIDNA